MGINEGAMAIERVKMMTKPKGMELDPKPFFKLNTSLTTTPAFIAYAFMPKFNDAEG